MQRMNQSEFKIRETAAAPFNVNPEIHPEDFIFQFLLDHESYPTYEAAANTYFSDGRNSALKFKSLIEDVCPSNNSQLKILEFASGFGCVTRHLGQVLPNCDITVCDIHPAAVDFTQEKLGHKAILSKSKPEDLTIDEKFDIVFALSFFSHMPKATFRRWLNRLASFLKPDGHLIMTTHGLISQSQLFKPYSLDGDGYLFLPSSEQKDLDNLEYGSAVVSPHYVFDSILESQNMFIVYFKEACWWTHQDCFVARKTNATGQIATRDKVRRHLSPLRVGIAKLLVGAVSKIKSRKVTKA